MFITFLQSQFKDNLGKMFPAQEVAREIVLSPIPVKHVDQQPKEEP